MDKLEYIQGDLVYIHGSLRIISNCDGYYATYYAENESLQEVNVNVIEGIPITKEILEKNGWDFTMYTDFNRTLLNIWSKRGILPDLYDYYATEGFSVSVCGKIVLSNIKYVHELQHLLFGLGLNSEMEV